jgi:transcriptional regulator with XRE-family HTH domain
VSRAERALDPDRSAQHRFGSELRRWRKTRGLSQDRLGSLVHVSGDLIYRVELAERRPARDLAERCDQVLETGGALAVLWDAAAAESAAARPASLPVTDIGSVGNSRSTAAWAAQLRSSRFDAYSPAAMGWPGVPAAAGAQITGTSLYVEHGEEILTVACQTADGRLILVAVPRRAFLAAGLGAAIAGVAPPASPALGAGAVSGGALQPLSAEALDRLHRIRRVLRDADNLFGPERVLPLVHEQLLQTRQLSAAARATDRSKLLAVQAQFADLYAWLQQDTGKHKEAQYWLDRALDWAQMARHSEATAFILARKSQVAGELNDATDAVDLAEVAIRQARPGHVRAASIAATYAAHGYAIQGDKTSCERQYARARDLLTQVEPDPSTSYGLFLNPAYIDVQRANSLVALGEHKAAADAFAGAIDSLPTGYHRDRGIYLVRKALAHAGAGEPDEAAASGTLALIIGRETSSSRILDGLTRLNSALSTWSELPQVAEFSDGFDAYLAGTRIQADSEDGVSASIRQ